MTLQDAPDEDRDVLRTVRILGGKKILRRQVCTRLQAHDLIDEGLPGSVLDHLQKELLVLGAGWRLQKVFGVGLRTMQRHRESPGRRLSAEQSGRTWKFAEILGRAAELFGSQEEAEAWLERPAMALDQRRPIDLLSTPAGVESVEELLTRLEYGVYT